MLYIHFFHLNVFLKHQLLSYFYIENGKAQNMNKILNCSLNIFQILNRFYQIQLLCSRAVWRHGLTQYISVCCWFSPISIFFCTKHCYDLHLTFIFPLNKIRKLLPNKYSHHSNVFQSRGNHILRLVSTQVIRNKILLSILEKFCIYYVIFLNTNLQVVNSAITSLIYEVGKKHSQDEFRCEVYTFYLNVVQLYM